MENNRLSSFGTVCTERNSATENVKPVLVNQLLQEQLHDRGRCIGRRCSRPCRSFRMHIIWAKCIRCWWMGVEREKKIFILGNHPVFYRLSQPLSAGGVMVSEKARRIYWKKEAGIIRWSDIPAELSSAKPMAIPDFTGTCVWVDPQYNILYIFLNHWILLRNNPRLEQ